MNNDLLTLPLPELQNLVQEWGFPNYRATQIYDWVHKKHVSSYEEMTNVPKALRSQLAETFPLSCSMLADKAISRDGARKYIMNLRDGSLVETVGMPSENTEGSKNRLTVCISSQVGCAMACSFCATGKEGFTRNLTAAELVEQVVTVQNDFSERVSNVVVMGQGEPFLNYDNVLEGVRLLNSADDLNIAARHIAISSCGIIEGIKRFEKEPEQFTLAISLHSATQETRDALMPRVANQKLVDLHKALNSYCENTNRRVTLEYLLIRDINDKPDDLKALKKFTKGLICHINLLAINPIEESIFRPPSKSTVSFWLENLNFSGIETSMRKPRGTDIAGACGQLKNRFSGI